MQMLFLLFKKEITKTFKLNYLKRGNVSQRNKIMASYIAVGVAFVFFLVRWIKLIFKFRSYNWMEEEIVPFLLTPVISVSVFLALIVGFFWGSGLIFFDKNYEVEYSWPVAVEITVVSKMLVPYFVLVLVDIALIGPLITLYGAVRAISIFFVLAAAVELLLLPVVPYLLGIVLGRLVLSLLQKKSSVTIRLGSIILVMMLGAYFFIVFYFSFSGSDGSQIVQQFISFFGSFTNKYFEGIFEFVFLNTSIYILTIGLLATVLFCLVVLIYKKGFSHLVGTESSQFKLTRNQKMSVKLSLFVRERKRYYSTSVYFLNTIIFPIMAVLLVAFIAIAKDEATQHIKVFATALKLLPSDTNILYSYMITMLITMFNTTGVSISIEKNKIEVLKSFPISAMDIFVPKVALQLYLSIPVIIVLNSVMAVMLKFDFRTILLGYLMPITFSAFSSVLGYGINILLPNFDWENITFVVKRSLSTIICAIANVLIALGNLVLLSRVKILDSYSTGFSTTIVVSILSFTIFLLILFKGDEQFSHMEL